METKAYYCNSRYYSPKLCRFISPNSIDYLDPENINGLNLNSYANNNPIGIPHSGFSAGFSASGGMVSTLSLGGSLSGVSSSSGSNVNVSASAWMQTLVGAVPDIILGIRYLNAKGIHTKFAYATKNRYMFPIMGETWRWVAQSSSYLSNFGNIAQASLKQILTGDAKAGFGEIAKSVIGTVGLNFVFNAIFNLYENDWNYKDADMWIDTGIDTAIGVGSYYLAAGTMSLVTAVVVSAGVAMPGIVVVGGVVLLSMGVEWLIREIFGYHQ